LVGAEVRAAFDAKVSALRLAAAQAESTGSAQELEVQFTEEELRSQVAAPTPVGEVIEVHLLDGKVVATASTIDATDVVHTVSLIARPLVTASRMQLVLAAYNETARKGPVVIGSSAASASVIAAGALPIPVEIESQIRALIDPARFGLPIVLSNVTILEGGLLVTGTTVP
jgi:hypothetical protein